MFDNIMAFFLVLCICVAVLAGIAWVIASVFGLPFIPVFGGVVAFVFVVIIGCLLIFG